MTGKQAQKVGAATAVLAVASAGFLLGHKTGSSVPAPRIGFAAAVPTCLTTLTVGGKPNVHGLVIWKYGTVKPTTTERVCWTRGYLKP